MLRPNPSLAARIAFSILLLSYCLGCGTSKFPVRPAKGKVVCDGRAVTVGSISFTPIGEANVVETGKSASATVGSDGTFTLTTFERFDGAIVGKHRVQYSGPEEEESSDESSSGADQDAPDKSGKKNAERIRQRSTAKRSQCVQQGEIIVEVQASGENNFTIELTAPRS